MNSLVNDLTQGNISGKLIKFSFPFVLANLLQALYSVVDMAVIGQAAGSSELAAVSISSGILVLYMYVSVGLASAVQVIIAQYAGRKEFSVFKSTIGTALSFMLLLSVACTVISLLLTDCTLRWMNTGAAEYAAARDYLVTCSWGLVFVYGYNTISAVLRGLGDSVRPLYFIIIAAFTNVVLDIFFVAVLHMGAFGAALATVIGQFVAFVASAIFLYRKRASIGFDFRPRSFCICMDQLKMLLKLGVPLALQNCAISVSMMAVNAQINTFGVEATAVTGIGANLLNIANIVTLSINSAASTMVGQNFGARLNQRVRQTVNISFFICFGYIVLLSFFVLIVPDDVFGLFNRDAAVLALARSYIPILLINFFGCAVRAPVCALINGIGYSSLNFIMGITDGIVMRIGLAFLLGLVLMPGVHGFWLGGAIAGYTYAIIGVPYYFSGRWEKRRLVMEGEQNK